MHKIKIAYPDNPDREAESLIKLNPKWWVVKLLESERLTLEKHACKPNLLHKDHELSAYWAVSLIINEPINSVFCADKSTQFNRYNIEVISRNDPDSRLWDISISPSKIDKGKVYVLCLTYLYPHFVFVVGYCFGSTILEHGVKRTHGGVDKEVLVLSRSRLKNVNELFNYVRSQQIDSQTS